MLADIQDAPVTIWMQRWDLLVFFLFLGWHKMQCDWWNFNPVLSLMLSLHLFLLSSFTFVSCCAPQNGFYKVIWSSNMAVPIFLFFDCCKEDIFLSYVDLDEVREKKCILRKQKPPGNGCLLLSLSPLILFIPLRLFPSFIHIYHIPSLILFCFHFWQIKHFDNENTFPNWMDWVNCILRKKRLGSRTENCTKPDKENYSFIV